MFLRLLPHPLCCASGTDGTFLLDAIEISFSGCPEISQIRCQAAATCPATGGAIECDALSALEVVNLRAEFDHVSCRFMTHYQRWDSSSGSSGHAVNITSDVIQSAPTRKREREIAPHPSLKPQSFMREIVSAVLPLGKGIVCDPFSGAGSTLAAAENVGYRSVGIELDPEYFRVACEAIPALAGVRV